MPQDNHSARMKVGDVLIARTFVLSPWDVVEHFGDHGCGRIVTRACPPDLIMTRAIEVVVDALSRRHRRAVVRSAGRPRLLAVPVIGEPLTPVATIRYLSMRQPQATHVTLMIEVRRRGGPVLVAIEVGIELEDEVHPVQRLDRDAA